MAKHEPSWTIGVEEEYLLIDPLSGKVAADPPKELFEECEKRMEGLVRPEFLRAQIEVGTKVCHTVKEVKSNLIDLRRTISEVSASFGLAPIAASTHPSAEWDELTHTDKERYHNFARDMQAVVRRLIISGMHVHVAIEDEDLRIDLMNQVGYFLPHLLALSTSSPFWRGKDTGLKCYRLAVFNELPRTGLPEQFDSYAEYERHVSLMVQSGMIKDASMLWWDVRPSSKFPTLEMRITDICTSLEDAIAIAALYQCLLRMLYRLRRNNQRWRIYRRLLIDENRWRAQRYGMDEGLADFGRGEIVPFKELLAELFDLLKEDAEALDCKEELAHLQVICQRGTSAQRQLDIFAKAKASGKDDKSALKDVVDWLVQETIRDL